MAQIKVNSSELNNTAGEYNKARTQMNNLLNRLRAVQNTLDKDIKATNNIDKTLTQAINELDNISKKTYNASTFLVNAANQLVRTELENAAYKDDSAKEQKWVNGVVPKTAVNTAAIPKSEAAKNSSIKIGSESQRQRQDWVSAMPIAMVAATGGNIGAAISNIDIKEEKKLGLVDSAVNTLKGAADTVRDKAKETASWAANKVKNEIAEQKKAMPETIAKEAASLGVTATGMAAGAAVKSLAKDLGIEGHSAKAMADFEKSGLETSSVMGGKDWSAVASASVGKVTAEANASASFDLAGGNLGAAAAVSFRATAAEATVAVAGKCGEASASAAAGVVAAKASAELSLMKDGVLVPKVIAQSNVGVSALQGTAMASTGSNMLGAGAKAIGDVGTATAGASAVLDPEKLTMEAKVSALAAAAKGTVGGTVKLAGIEAGVHVTGMAGAIGIESGVSLDKSGKLKVELGGAIIGGVKVEAEINAGNALKTIDKATGGAVSGALSVVNGGIQVVAAPVGAAIQAGKVIGVGAKDFVTSVAKGDISGAAKAVANTGVNLAKAAVNSVASTAKAVVNTGSKIISTGIKIFKKLMPWNW